jgi:hypothetical protein
MRGFMRAIGLGGLFKRKSKATNAATFRAISIEDALEAFNENLIASRIRGSLVLPRESSIIERSQFLFFCGSDHDDTSPLRTAKYDFKSSYVNLPKTPKNPDIHREFPVFFNPMS